MGELDHIDVFQNRMLFQCGKINPKLKIFNLPCTKNRERFAQFFGWQISRWLYGDFSEMHCGGFYLFWHGCNQLEF